MASAAAIRLRRASKGLKSLPGEFTSQGAKRIAKAARTSMARDTGGDRRLSGLGRSAKPLRVRVINRDGREFSESRVMAGPRELRAAWFWLEEGTEAGARRIRGTSRRYRPGGGTQTFQHPGTPAKQTWTKAVRPILDDLPDEFEREYRRAVRG